MVHGIAQLARQPETQLVHLARPGPHGGPPNNWLSNFGGPAWKLDPLTGQYFYHAFLNRQPDLNWRNPEVRAAMHDVLRFWLDRGVDGFRVDVIWHIVKDEQFRDNPRNPNYQPGQNPTTNCFRPTPPTSPKSTQSSRRCGRCWTATTSG